MSTPVSPRGERTASPVFKVGELARQTGLTVRTLHHYDQIGLLSPSRRTASGHRLYETAEIARLQQIRSLQSIGLSLGEIADLLDNRNPSLRDVVAMHLDRLHQRIEDLQRVAARLEKIARDIDGGRVADTENLLRSIEAMSMFDKYYTPEQMKQLEQRRAEVGEERIAAARRAWSELYEKARIEMEKGTDPADGAVQALVRASRNLIEEFTGGDEGIRASLANMRRQEPSVRRQWGPSPEVGEYLRRAAEVGGSGGESGDG